MYLRGETLSLIYPELLLVIAGTLIIVGGAFWRSRSAWSVVAALGVIVAGLSLIPTAGNFVRPMLESTAGPFALDSLGLVGRWLALGSGLLFVLTSVRRSSELEGGELPGLLLLLTAGVSFSCWSNNVVLLFLALELVSIPTYVLLFIGRADRDSAEAAIKYFLLSIMSSAVFLLGLALLFGMTGSLEFDDMARNWSQLPQSTQPGLAVAMMFILGGLSFRLAAVPFHFYAPDVYQATTNANAGLLAVAPKIVGVVALVRFLNLSVAAESSLGWMIVVILALATMSLGNLIALWQRNVRRLLAYSSIAHGGYLLIGLAVALAPASVIETGNILGFAAAMLYLVVYTTASLGVFSILCELSSEGRELSRVEELHGLYRRRPWMAAALAVCLFSLTGIPPLAGFWGKFQLIAGSLRTAGASDDLWQTQWFLGLSIVAMINAAIAAAYYLRIAAAAYFFADEQPADDMARPSSRSGGVAGLAGVAAAAVTVLIGIFPGPVLDWCQVRSVPAAPAATVTALGATPPQLVEMAAVPDESSRLDLFLP